MAERIPMLLDCDPGVDDSIAILTAAAVADVIGITTVSGNVGIDHTTHNALAVTEAAGLDIPVHRGAARPLEAAPRDARHVHGPTGLGAVRIPDVHTSVASDDAVTFLLDMARTIDDLHLVAIGPLTNVALALDRDPTLPELLGGLTIMGGAAAGGNVTPSAEFNIWADPEAADVVFRRSAPLTMVGLDVTHQVLLDSDSSARLRVSSSRAAALAADLLDFIIDGAAARGWKGSPVHDACAVLAVTHPELFGGSHHDVSIELTGTHTRGMTVVDTRPGELENDTAHRVLREVDAAAVVEAIVQAVLSLPAG